MVGCFYVQCCPISLVVFVHQVSFPTYYGVGYYAVNHKMFCPFVAGPDGLIGVGSSTVSDSWIHMIAREQRLGILAICLNSLFLTLVVGDPFHYSIMW